MWIKSCWIVASIFVIPLLSKDEPKGQVVLANTLFALVLLTVAGSTAGFFMGPMGLLKEWWLFGNQGWEFVELGKFWQTLLFVFIGLWALLLYRGLHGSLKFEHHPAKLARSCALFACSFQDL
jgi:nitric oxide reductase subunit B